MDAEGNINYSASARHIKYWTDFSLPVILVIYSPQQSKAWWCDVKEYFSRHPKKLDGSGHVIRIPSTSVLTVADKSLWVKLAYHPSHPLDLTKKNYSIIKKADVSTAAFKRYRAEISVGNYVNREIIRLAIFQVVNYLKTIVEHSSDIQEKHWVDHPPHLIAIFVYFDTDDKHYTQWTARAIWRDKLEILENQWTHINANDFTDNIEIEFTDEEKRKVFKDFLASSESTKTHFIKKVNIWVPMSETLVVKAQELFESLTKEAITQEIFEETMKHLALKFDIIMNGYDDGTTAPAECHDAQQSFLQCIYKGHDVFLAFTERGLKTWPDPENRKMLLKQALQDFVIIHLPVRIVGM